MSESDVPSDAEDEPEGLTNWQARDRFVRKKVANMYRFTNNVDIRRMPKNTYEIAMADREAVAVQARNRRTTNAVKRMFQKNSIVSIYRDDHLYRVVLTETLPFMCSICGETFAFTKPLENHVEEEHGYFQNLLDESEARKKPVIIEKHFNREKEETKSISMEDTTPEPEDSPNQETTVKDETTILVDQNGTCNNDTMDNGLPEVPSDAESEGTGVQEEAQEPDASSEANGTNPEEGVEHILTQMANQREAPTRKRVREEDCNSSEATMPAKNTSGDILVVTKKHKKKKKKRRKEKYIVLNAEHVFAKEEDKQKREKEKQCLDENGQPRETKTLKPFCVVCHLHCITRVACRAHLAEAHNIFPSREDAEKAREKMRRQNGDEVTGSDEQRHDSENGDEVTRSDEQRHDSENFDEVTRSDEQRHDSENGNEVTGSDEQRHDSENGDEVTGSDEQRHDSENGDEVTGSDEQGEDSSHEQQDQSNEEIEIIKCDFCETYVFDEATLEKHMRAHCGIPGIKCDICREGIRLWENARMEELNDLAERMLARDRRPQDVDCDPGKPRKYPNSKVVHTCYECNEQYYYNTHIANHYSKAHASITCKDCGTSVPTMQALAAHSVQNHNPGIFRCQWCPRHFHDRGKFNYHLAGHMGQYRCSGCGRNFLEKPSLLLHLKKYEKHPEHFQGRQTTTQEISHDKPFIADGVTERGSPSLTVMVCEYCGATFVHRGMYNKHMNKVHPGHAGQSVKDSYICDTCGNVYWSKANLTTHKRIHNKKNPCPYPGCTKKFWAVGMLRKHMETHEGAPTYYCKDCGKTFQHSGSLRLHKRTHTSKVCKCKICKEEFKGLSNLADHMQEVHNQELRVTCGVCGEQLASRQHLLSHAKVHNDQLNGFTCEKCTCVFPEEKFLLQHMHIHNKTYKCRFCNVVFSSADDLKSHQLKEHAMPAQGTVQNFTVDGMEINMQEMPEGVVIVEYPVSAGDQEATDRAIAAIVSELQG